MDKQLNPDSTSLYARAVTPEGADSLSRIARLVKPQSRVLDLGAYTGALGKYLKENLACTLDGVELDQEAATLARPFYDKMLVADLESLVLADHFPSGSYDYVVCADVLEHLRDPGQILEQAKKLLAAGGRLLVSIPNIGYAGVVADLLQGDFHYRPTGVLDSTHLRFFTRNSLVRFLAGHGFEIRHVETVNEDLTQSEFRRVYLERLPPALFRAILANPDALSYQFIVEAAAGETSVLPANEFPPTPVARFSSQLYWRGKNEEFREENSRVVSGVIGAERQFVDFDIPLLDFPLAALRLDLADRPGYMRLYGIRLYGPTGEMVWEWAGDMATLAGMSCHDVAFAADSAGSVLLRGEDPYIELTIPPAQLGVLQRGGRLTLEAGWPVSADFLAAGEKIKAIETQKQIDAEQFQAEIHSLLARQATDSQALAQKDSQLAQKDSQLAQKDSQLAQKDGHISNLDQQIHALNASAAALSQDNLRLRTELNGMLASASWRLTAPLRRGKAFMRRVYRLFLWRPHRMSMEAVNDLVRQDDLFHSTGPDPYFRLGSDHSFMPRGWCLIAYAAHSEGKPLRPVLYFDTGSGFSEENKLLLPVSTAGRVSLLAQLPQHVIGLRLDPTDGPGEFSFRSLTITEIGKLEAGLMLAWPFFRRMLHNPLHLFPLFKKTFTLFKSGGLAGIKHKLVTKNQATDYQTWVALYDTLSDQDRAAIRRHIEALACRPLISVVMPTYNTPEKWLRLAIDSVRNQLYPNWELCIADDASTLPHVRKILEEYRGKDNRIKIVFREQNGHISEASNSALDLATGEFVALLDHDDELAEHALYHVVQVIGKNPLMDLIFSDEDKIDVNGRRSDPYFKPDWDPFLLQGQNYISHLGVYRLSRVRAIGGFRKNFEGSQDWDLVLRFTEKLPEDHIVHIPTILYHWRILPGSTALADHEKSYARTAAKLALEEHYQRIGIRAEVMPNCGGYWRAILGLPDQQPLVSLIIPTRNHVELLRQCISSILEKTTYKNFEIIVVDNQSDDPASLDYLESLIQQPNISVIRFDAPFNYSAINNFAVRHARGSLVGLINNDIEVITPQWLENMVAYASLPRVGAVGAMLYYPDNTIQHAGVITGLGGVANHCYVGKPRGHHGYFGRAALTQSFSAVTAACLLVRKDVFDEVKGLDEKNLTIAFNDIDFCLRLRERGYRNVWLPFVECYHHESASRGKHENPQKSARFMDEIIYMRHRWEDQLVQDPAYNPNLALDRDSFCLAFPPRVSKSWTVFQ